MNINIIKVFVHSITEYLGLLIAGHGHGFREIHTQTFPLTGYQKPPNHFPLKTGSDELF